MQDGQIMITNHTADSQVKYPNERISGPSETKGPINPYYYKFGGIETIDFIEAKKLDYNLGNVIKYVSRAGHKGHELEDLKKAAWYLEREIAQHGR